MPNKQKEPNALLVVIKKSGASFWEESDMPETIYAGYRFTQIVCLQKADFRVEKLRRPLDQWQRCSGFGWLQDLLLDNETQLEEIHAFAKNGTASELENILDVLGPRLIKAARFTATGFGVSAKLFHRVTAHFKEVRFARCRLQQGWWNSPQVDKACTDIRFEKCVAQAPKAIREGQITWPKLRTILVWDGDDQDLSPIKSLPERQPDFKFKGKSVAASMVTGLWNAKITRLCLTDCTDVGFLSNLCQSKKLNSVCLANSSVSLKVFDWICLHKLLNDLDLAWEFGTKLPWRKLRNLKRLTSLDLSSTYLNDAQLAEIAECLPYVSFSAYYTALTPASWKTVLKWPSLRQFWGSQEMMEGTMPDDLPETTQLEEFVALNAHTEQFRKFLARYPNVNVVGM